MDGCLETNKSNVKTDENNLQKEQLLTEYEMAFEPNTSSKYQMDSNGELSRLLIGNDDQKISLSALASKETEPNLNYPVEQNDSTCIESIVKHPRLNHKFINEKKYCTDSDSVEHLKGRFVYDCALLKQSAFGNNKPNNLMTNSNTKQVINSNDQLDSKQQIPGTVPGLLVLNPLIRKSRLSVSTLLKMQRSFLSKHNTHTRTLTKTNSIFCFGFQEC